MDSVDHTESDIDNEEFYFESDHLALRGNADYTAVLRTIAILQAQRIQATKDVDKLALVEKEALEDPEKFIKKLSSGEDLDITGSLTIVDLPKINFEKYNVNFPEFPKEVQGEGSNNQDMIVRGRLFDQSKPETFNQLWTCEEQRRLEELLVEYPPEPIEMRRFAKIARALGNRTTKQVASRVQKFFKKLHSAGMPVPGRAPKAQRQYISKNHRVHKHSLRPSTFFPAHDVPVTMPEDDDLSSFDPLQQRNTSSRANSITSFDRDQPSSTLGVLVVDEESDDDEGTSSDGDVEKLRLLKLFMRVRRDKEKDTPNRPGSEHIGYSCNLCSDDPILGTRWQCLTCKDTSIDFCSDCLIAQTMSNNPHPITHKFRALRVGYNPPQSMMYGSPFEADSEGDDADEDSKIGLEGNVYDKDYMTSKFSKQEYNYLDPNFLPE